MRWLLISLVLLAALTVSAAVPQDVPAPAPAPVVMSPAKAQFFSGFVTEKNETSLTVSRKGVGKEMLHHTFLLSPDTKVEGNLKVNARVTVRFDIRAEGDHAIRIIVRN